MSSGIKYALEDWKRICTEKHNGKYNYDAITEYINKEQKMKIFCNQHQCWFEQTANSHIRGMEGCPLCKKEKYKKNALKSLDYAKNKIEDAIKGKNLEVDYSTYKGISEPITVYCHNKDLYGNEHGEFQPLVYNLINGHGCKKCSIDKNANRSRTDFNEFMEKIKILHPNLDFSLVKPFKNVDEQICVICHEKDEFGEEHGAYYTTPHRLLNGNKCKKCLRLEKVDVETWKKRCTKIHQNKYIYDEVNFDNLSDIVNIICKKHGLFKQTAMHHLYGHGCPICCESRIEKLITMVLNENQIEFQHNDRKTLNGLELDFLIPSKNIAIECQGEQHFKPKSFGCHNEQLVKENFDKQIERDKRKKDLCKDNGIDLIYFLDEEYNKYLEEGDIYFNNVEDLISYILK